MRKFIPSLLLLLLVSCATEHKNPLNEPSDLYSIFNGVYQSENGSRFRVKGKDTLIVISTDSVNLYNFADNWADERVQKCNENPFSLLKRL